MWEDVPNYVGRRERFVGNSGPRNEAKNVTEGVDAFKMFFTEVIEIIIRKMKSAGATFHGKHSTEVSWDISQRGFLQLKGS
jgi:hypothetical protein